MLHRLMPGLLAAAAMSTPVSAAIADPVVDQVSPLSAFGLGAFIADGLWQQSVMVGVTGQLMRLDIQTDRAGAVFTVSLNRGSGWQVDTPDITIAGLFTNATGFVEVDLSGAGLFFTAGDEFMWSASSPQASLLGNAFDVYARGALWRDEAIFDPNQQWDMGFVTYVQAAPVPEPGTPLMLLAGLALLARLRSRRGARVS